MTIRSRAGRTGDAAASGPAGAARTERAVPKPSASSPVTRARDTPLLDLQRSAGNAAVARLMATGVAGPAGTIVQRDYTTPKIVQRPGEAWAYGPITKRKSVQHDLATFVHWIRVVENAYGPDKQAVLQRLRRLYYSSYSGKAGGTFDRAIEDQPGAGGPPLDTLRIGDITLDGLFETDTIRTLTGEILDPGHILAALDVSVSGVTTKAGVGAAVYDAPWTGIVTWTGDLASWFVEWSQQIRKAMTTPPPAPTGPATDEGPESERGPGPIGDSKLWESVGASKTSKADLLGDMDAEVLASRSIRRSTAESVKAEKREIRNANIAWELTMPVSTILEQYYGIGMGIDKPTEAEGRFPVFVKNAVPGIPHRIVPGASGTKGSVELAPGAEDAIHTAVRNTARLFIDQGTSDPSDPVGTYPGRLRDIAKRFTTFLATGLKSGDAPWP